MSVCIIMASPVFHVGLCNTGYTCILCQLVCMVILTPVFLVSWSVEGGETGTKCGPVSNGNALTFDRNAKRQVCTQYLDAESVGALHFTFGMGGYETCTHSTVQSLVVKDHLHVLLKNYLSVSMKLGR